MVVPSLQKSCVTRNSLFLDNNSNSSSVCKMKENHSISNHYLKIFEGVWTLKELLIVAVIAIISFWYIGFLWRRRKLYQFSSQLPGPFALPFIGSAFYFIGNPYDIFCNITMMFNKYPGIFKVWFGTRLFYCISEPKYMEIILPVCLQKERLYQMANIIVGQGLFTAPVHKWRHNRKVIAPTFNQKVLDGFLEVFVEQSDVLIAQLKKYDNRKEIDIFHVISKCTLDIICETSMGVKVHAQTTDAQYTTWADRVLEVTFLRIFVLWYQIDWIFNLLPIGKATNEMARKMHEFSGKVVREKKSKFEKEKLESIYNPDGLKRKAFLDYLIELTQTGDNRFSEEQLRQEVDTFIVAGSDTTATTNCFILTMLGLHQDLQEKVYNEIMDIVGPDRCVELDDLPKLKYMERFIKETLRLFPVAGIIVREVEQDVDIGDYIVPAGISIVFGILRTHTNEAYWPNPMKFDPDRFLPEEIAKRPACSYLPFSYGPRNCIGLRYAMMAMKSLMVALLRKYRFFTHYKRVEDIKLKANLVVRPKDGFKVYLESR